MYQTLAAGAFIAPAIFQRTHGDAAEASTRKLDFLGQNGTELRKPTAPVTNNAVITVRLKRGVFIVTQAYGELESRQKMIRNPPRAGGGDVNLRTQWASVRTSCSLVRHSPERTTGCTNKRPSGPVLGHQADWCPYRDQQPQLVEMCSHRVAAERILCGLTAVATGWQGIRFVAPLASSLLVVHRRTFELFTLGIGSARDHRPALAVDG